MRRKTAMALSPRPLTPSAFLVMAAIFFAAVFAYMDTSMMTQGWPVDFPGALFFRIPSIGLSYMMIFFHELGHAAAGWSFGIPSLPSFDFQHGGGMTYGFGRSWFLQIAVWLGMAGVLTWLVRHDEWRFAAPFGLFFVFHLISGLTGFYETVVSFMGHGGEMCLACFCLSRASAGLMRRGADLVIALILGYFTLFHGVLMFAALWLSPMARMVYQDMKGGEIHGDIDAIASQTGASASTVSFLVWALFVILLIYQLWRQCRPKTALPAELSA